MANFKKIEARKTQILKTAERFFGEKGFQETTISGIAKESKISEASIYEYFSTKEGLLFSVPTKNASELFKLMQFHLTLIRGAENKLRSIIYIFLSTNEENPNNASILMLILKHNKKFLNSEGHLEIKKGLKMIDEAIEEGILAGEFRNDINVYLTRSMIIGTIEHLVTSWLMTGRPESLVDLVDPLIDTIIAGIQATKKQITDMES